MAVLLDCSDELIVLIASNISKPSHLLQLALVGNKRIHGIVIQHLYGNLTFDQGDYPAFLFGFTRYNDNLPLSVIRYDNAAPHSNMWLLSNMIRFNAIPAGQTITRLNITIGVNREHNMFQTLLSALLPQLSSLRDLTLRSVSQDPFGWMVELFSPLTLGIALDASSRTLHSLDMHFFLDPDYTDGWTIGSLRHFSQLKYLSAQADVLLCPYRDLDHTLPMLDSVLPPGLKRLRLYWCRIPELHYLIDILDEFVTASVRASGKLEVLVVELDAEPSLAIEHATVQFFKRKVARMNEAARLGGLDLVVALERRKADRWHRPVYPDGSPTRMAQLFKIIGAFLSQG